MQCPKDFHPSERFFFFLSSLLEKNKEKRFTIQNVIESAWFQYSLSKINKNIIEINNLNPKDVNFDINLNQPTSKINNLSSIKLIKIAEKSNKYLNISEFDKKNRQKNILRAKKASKPIDPNSNFIINGTSKCDGSKINIDKKTISRKPSENNDNIDVFLKKEHFSYASQTKELRLDILNSRETKSFNLNEINTMNNKESFHQMNKNGLILELLQRNSERLSFKTNSNSSSFSDHEGFLEDINRNSKRESISQITANFLETNESKNILGNKFQRIERKKENKSIENKELINLKTEENKSDNLSTQLPTPQSSTYNTLNKNNKNNINNNNDSLNNINNNSDSLSPLHKDNCSLDENFKNDSFEFSIGKDKFSYYSDKIKNKSRIDWNEAKAKNNFLCFRGNNDNDLQAVFNFFVCLYSINY